MTNAASAPDERGRHDMDRALIATMVVIGAVVVLPATFFLGALGTLGVCYSSCTDFKEAVLFVAFGLVPVAYAVGCVAFLRKVRRGRMAKTVGGTGTGEPVAAWPFTTAGSVIAWGLVAILLVLMTLVVTCFALLGIL